MQYSQKIIAPATFLIMASCAMQPDKSSAVEETTLRALAPSQLAVLSPLNGLVQLDAEQQGFVTSAFVGPAEDVVSAFGPKSEKALGKPWDLAHAGFKFKNANGKWSDLQYSGFRFAIVTSSKHRQNEELTAADFLELVSSINEVVEGQASGESGAEKRFQELLRGYFNPSTKIDYSGAMNIGTVFRGPDRYGFLVNFMGISEEGPVSIACVFSVVFVNGQAFTLKLFEGTRGEFVWGQLAKISDEWTQRILDSS